MWCHTADYSVNFWKWTLSVVQPEVWKFKIPLDMQDWTIYHMSSDSWKNIKDLVILEADVLKVDYKMVKIRDFRDSG